MIPSYRTLKMYNYFDTREFVEKTLNHEFNWELMDDLFGEDKVSNDTIYECWVPSENTLSKYGCSDETFFNVIVATLWGNYDRIAIKVCW